MKHNEIFSMIKNKKDWTHCKSGKLSAEWGTYEETVPEKTIKIKEDK